MVSHLLGYVDNPSPDYVDSTAKANPNLSQKQKRNSSSNTNSNTVNKRAENYFELVKLYKVSLTGKIQPNLSINSSETVRVFTIIPPKQFAELFTSNSWAKSTTSQIFSENPGNIQYVCMYVCISERMLDHDICICICRVARGLAQCIQ